MTEKKKKAENYINKLALIKHPEGGWYREIYKSEEKIKKENLPERYGGDRHHSTSIYFLLTSGSPSSGRGSAMHRIKSDEIWHFYDGDAVTVHMIDGSGSYSTVRLGRNIDEGEIYQFTIPYGTWFAAEVEKPDSFALVGCTVAPGFDFDDFELANREKLINLFPHLDHIVLKCTCK